MSEGGKGGEVYLWLCCEGWVRFGPFPWLRFDDNQQVVLDDTGQVIAVRAEDGWHTPGSHQGYRWSDPMVTASPRRPHRHSGSPTERQAARGRPAEPRPDNMPEVVKAFPPRGGLQLFRLERPHEFVCGRCGQAKESKVIAVEDGDWTKLLCNACHGNLLSRQESQ